MTVTQQCSTSLKMLRFYEQDVCRCIRPNCAALLCFLPPSGSLDGPCCKRTESGGCAPRVVKTLIKHELVQSYYRQSSRQEITWNTRVISQVYPGSVPFPYQKPLICPPTIFTSDWICLYKKMFSSVPLCSPTAARSVNLQVCGHTCGLWWHSESIPELCLLQCGGDLRGRSSIFPACAAGHGHADPDWQSSQTPPGGRTRLIGSEQILRRSEIKDKEMRACALILLMSREWARVLCLFETLTYRVRCRTGNMHACSYEHVDRGGFKLLHGICMDLADITKCCVCLCMCVWGGGVAFVPSFRQRATLNGNALDI